MKAAAGTNRTVSRHIKLLRYQPPSGGASRTFGAVWQLGNEVRWTSPITRRLNDVLDPKLFVDRFPEATYEFDHFAAAITWLQSVCSAARELLDVAQACQTEPGLGLSCVRYEGPDRGGDLASLLEGENQAQLLDVEMLRTVVNLTLEHLVKEHAVLKGLPLELISEEGSSECARLLLPDDRLVRIYFDRDTRPSRVVPQLLAESDRLFRLRSDSEVSFFVFAQLKGALPLRLTTSVLATGMRLPHIANGLVRLVWATPLSS
ncbi:hypothetical protein LJR084_007168 [Variovorax sp. LjRoot84]|uniref:hypothetical protein n=1 Tax=Variovorax sp. LjRoot84 TaxID=3342340 RepID=UPI003ECF49CB